MIGLALTSCDVKINKQADKRKIQEFEKRISLDPYNVSDSVANALIKEYFLFAAKFPQDTISAEYLFRAGDIKRGLGFGEDAVKIYDDILVDYPNYSKTPIVIFAQGYIYMSELKMGFKAEQKFNEFILKYPNHPLVEDAKALISTIGMSDEELMDFLKKKNPDNE